MESRSMKYKPKNQQQNLQQSTQSQVNWGDMDKMFTRKVTKIDYKEEEIKASDIKSSVQEEVKNQSSNNKMQRIILWFRNDLRLHDNAIINYAVKHSAPNKQIVPVFCYDPRFHAKKVQQFGTQKCGLVRQRFLIETVENFRHNLEKMGSKLLVSMERPEEFIPKLIDQECDNTIVYQDEICSEEMAVERAVQKSCKGANVKTFWGSSVYHVDDLGFEIDHLPQVYTKFREVCGRVPVRSLFPNPKNGDLPFIENPSDIMTKATIFSPQLEDFGFTKEQIALGKDKRSVIEFIGGEDAALKRFKEYVYETQAVSHYADTRNELLGENVSSRFSPWMAHGSLSPRYIYHKVKEYESKNQLTEKSTKKLIDEVFWRDWCRFWALKYGNNIFGVYGFDYERGSKRYQWTTNPEIVRRWRQGTTGMPLIDAFMRELNFGGFMSNRGRQIVASYLVLDLNQDWRFGAHHFEEKLIDHDVHSNYASWNFAAGIGPSKVLQFNVQKQSRDHDKNGEFIKTWVPELRNVPLEYIHEPWTMSSMVQEECGVIIGKDYPKPIQSRYTQNQVKSQGSYAQNYQKNNNNQKGNQQQQAKKVYQKKY
eukprot:403349181